jgi:hypothetical protein
LVALRRAATLSLREAISPTRLLMLLEQVSEGLVGEFLEAPAAPSHNGVHGLPGLVVELNALARHNYQTGESISQESTKGMKGQHRRRVASWSPLSERHNI